TFGAGNDQEFIGKLKQLTLDHLADERFGGKELAVAMGMSWSTLNRKLQALTGQHITQFIREIRLQKALELLQENNATAAEVAYKVGFGGPAYFNKCFNDFFGFSPGEVKKKLAEGTLPLAEDPLPAEDIPEAETTVPVKKDRVRRTYRMAAFAATGLLILALVLFFITQKGDFSYQLSEKEKSIAVLPFKNLSHEADNQYFADGITEDILNHLFRISDLRVISRTTAERFRDSELSTTEIAKTMGVNYLLEGSVRKQGDQVRITVQLIDGKSDRHLWSENYDRQLADIFFIQSDIAQNVARELRAVLSPIEIKKLQTPSTTNPEAYNAYLMGRFYWNRPGLENLEKSFASYEKALALDPEYALAFAGLSDAYLYKAIYGAIPFEEGLQLAKNSAQKALDIDPNLSEAYVALGGMNILEWNWKEAHKVLSKAIHLNPNNGQAQYMYGLVLTFLNEKEKALEHLGIAVSLEPFQPGYRFAVSNIYFHQENYQKAYDIQLECMELMGKEPNPDVYFSLFSICLWLIDDEKALENLGQFLEFSPSLDGNKEKMDSVYQASGIEGIMRWVHVLLNKTRISPSVQIAGYYAYLNEKDSVLYYLEKSYEEHDLNLVHSIYLPFIRRYSDEPRFSALVDKMGLKDYYYKYQQ
ncbi:MAG: helix-turn-helix domain-containing protein, partial [Bacteroidales bacterium]|nr:helix-turn-helix domain-containing protein [Bacteroidales bacterium]